jgi:hypothetical protein
VFLDWLLGLGRQMGNCCGLFRALGGSWGEGGWYGV